MHEPFNTRINAREYDRFYLSNREPLDLLNKLVTIPKNHQPDTCPECGLKRYARMSDEEKQIHMNRHKDKAAA